MKTLEENVKATIADELESANSKFPPFHSTHEGYAVILEELEETMEALKTVEIQMGFLWQNVRKNNFMWGKRGLASRTEVKYLEAATIRLAEESIQVAAMVKKFLQCVGEPEKGREPIG